MPDPVKEIHFVELQKTCSAETIKGMAPVEQNRHAIAAWNSPDASEYPVDADGDGKDEFSVVVTQFEYPPSAQQQRDSKSDKPEPAWNLEQQNKRLSIYREGEGLLPDLFGKNEKPAKTSWLPGEPIANMLDTQPKCWQEASLRASAGYRICAGLCADSSYGATVSLRKISDPMECPEIGGLVTMRHRFDIYSGDFDGDGLRDFAIMGTVDRSCRVYLQMAKPAGDGAKATLDGGTGTQKAEQTKK